MRQIIPRRRVSPQGGRLKRFFNSFRPSQFRGYWLSRAGAWRLTRLAGHGGLMIALVVLFIARDLPSPGKINARIGAQTTRFYDRTGTKVLYEVFGNQNRSVIAFNQIPSNLKDATIAVEDRNFYRHGAFSWLSILRAAFVDLLHPGSGLQGGSTITQQYVKNSLLTPDQSFSRKVKELILSIVIEQFYSKNDILSLYLNEIPYGTNAYGIEAASKTYFNKDAKNLNLKQAALLAAIPRAPTYYWPYGAHRDDLVARQNLILDLMVQQRYITEAQAKGAKLKSVRDLSHTVLPTPNYVANITAPHFVFWLQEQLEAKYGTQVVTEGGLKVITTIDLKKQDQAQAAVADNMGGVRSLGGTNAALVSTDPKTGQILAMVGSYNYSDPKFGAFNVATAERQPGSSFKPFAYATAFGKNYGAGSTLYDVQTDFGGGYKPHNFCFCNYGVMSMRQSLGGSLNIPAVKTLYLAGIPNVIDTAQKMGISTLGDPSHYGLSLVLGSAEVKPIEMANAYESFANGGFHNEQTAVLKVTDPNGRVLEEYKPKPPKQVIDPQVAYLISNILSDNPNRAFVFGCLLCMPDGRPVAIKTGTTENYRDAWTMGYTPSLVAAVWAGNNDNTPMSAAAADVSAPILKQYMAKALAGTPFEKFSRPPGLKTVTLDANTGKLPTSSTKRKRTDIFPSWYKPASVTSNKSAVIDKVSGKLATSCTPSLAKETIYSSDMHAEIPPSDPAYPRWEPPVEALARSLGFKQGGTLPTTSDNVHHCGDAQPQVSISAADLGEGYIKLTTTVTAGKFTPKSLTIYRDDQIISSKSLSGGTTYTFATHTGDGGHEFKAKVIDSAYYQTQDSTDVTVSGSATFSGQSPSGSCGCALHANFSWDALTVTEYRLYVSSNGGSTYNLEYDGGNNSTNAPVGAGSNDAWYVEAYDSGTFVSRSQVLTFSSP